MAPPEDHPVLLSWGEVSPAFVVRGAARRVPSGAGSVDFLPTAGSVQCLGSQRSGRTLETQTQKGKACLSYIPSWAIPWARPTRLEGWGRQAGPSIRLWLEFPVLCDSCWSGRKKACSALLCKPEPFLFLCQTLDGETSVRGLIRAVWWQSSYLCAHLAVAEGSTSQC